MNDTLYGKFKIIKLIEKTKYNQLYLVYNKEQEINAVAKITDIKNRESHLLKVLKHDNIVKLYEDFIMDGKKNLIIEYLPGGDLYSMLPYINEENIDNFFIQLLEGLQYIHSQGVAHRDIKPENIMYDGELNMKFIDFGLSCQIGQYRIFDGKICGTLPYMPPELFDSKNNVIMNLFAIDIWALGIVFMMMIIKQFPWEVAKPKESKHYRMYIEGDFTMSYWNDVNPKYIDTIKMMLNNCPFKRGNIQEVIDKFKQIDNIK